MNDQVESTTDAETQKASQLIADFVVRYSELRRKNLAVDLYSFAAFRRRTWLKAAKRREEYVRLVKKEVSNQAQSLEDVIGFCKLHSVPRQARLLAATSLKTAAVRLKNRADFMSTYSGMLSLTVTAALLAAKIYVDLSLGWLFFPIMFSLFAHLERHWTLDESVIFEEACEILASKYLGET